MTAQPTVLPICTVQHDFKDMGKDVLDGMVPEDTFWVSCYKFGEPSVHGKATAELDERNRDLLLYRGRGGVEFKSAGEASYSIACPALGIGETRIAVPRKAYPPPPDVHKGQITAFDVAPDGSQIATGYHDGSVYVRAAEGAPTAPHISSSKPHLSTVASLRFFPSSRVLLSAGADFALTILPADPPPSSPYTTSKITPARTLRGHTRAITSTAIIARGRNVLSGSKDGTVRLWDIPSGSQIRTLTAGSNHFVPVLALSSGETWEGAPHISGDQEATESPDPREVETSGKVVFCALQDGSFELFDLRTKQAVFRSAPGSSGARSALQALAYSQEHGLVATGSAAGLTSIYDVRALEAGPTSTFRRNEAPIEDIVFVGYEEGTPNRVGVVVATEDGLPYIANIQPHGPSVHVELVGTDCDGVRFVRAVGGDVWTAADDGIVRRYGRQ
ncbi:WD40 repeat-like protein [Lenzites betulinus]|nr:WD40 repeat-like protein [Lenzites betulinus]